MGGRVGGKVGDVESGEAGEGVRSTLTERCLSLSCHSVKSFVIRCV